MEPWRRTVLMRRRWFECPPSMPWPDVTEMPSDVPRTFDSMSWVAKPLPANRTSIHPSRTSPATAGPPPVWIDGGTTHGEHPLAALACRPHALGDLGDEDRLRLLRADLGVHELEGATVARLLRRVDADTDLPDDDEIAGPDPVHRHGPHRRAVGGDDEPAVHLRVGDRHPVAVEADVGRQVRRRVEALGKHAVDARPRRASRRRRRRGWRRARPTAPARRRARPRRCARAR